MFPQTTLDQVLQRTAIAARRADLCARQCAAKAPRRDKARRAAPDARPAVCCVA